MKLNKPLVCWLFLMIWHTAAFTQENSKKAIGQMIEEYRYNVSYLSVSDDTRLAYVDEGSGEHTLLFIHGLATYIPAWYKNIEYFKKKYRCIAIDLPGYGRSSKNDYPATMSYYAQVVLLLIEKLELENVILVGHSMGGQIAATVAINNPELFEKLVLLAPAGFETFNEEQKQWLKAVFNETTMINATESQIRSNWELNFHQMPDEVEFMIQDRLKMKEAEDFQLYIQSVVRGVHGMLEEPIADRLSQLETKTLVVYGENDQLIPNRYLNPKLTTRLVAQQGTEKIARAHLHFIPECGHFISFDKPDEINEIMEKFLTE